MMARYPYSPAPTVHGPDRLDVSTIPVPARWLADWPAARETPGQLVLTETALDHLVEALAGQRIVGLPRTLRSYGMVALLDAAWVQQSPWRQLVERRLRDRARSHRDLQQHLYQLQDRWNHVWTSRYGLYTK